MGSPFAGEWRTSESRDLLIYPYLNGISRVFQWPLHIHPTTTPKTQNFLQFAQFSSKCNAPVPAAYRLSITDCIYAADSWCATNGPISCTAHKSCRLSAVQIPILLNSATVAQITKKPIFLLVQINGTESSLLFICRCRKIVASPKWCLWSHPLIFQFPIDWIAHFVKLLIHRPKTQKIS